MGAFEIDKSGNSIDLFSWASVKYYVEIQLVNKAWNQEKLKGAAYQDYLDLAAVFKVYLNQGEKYEASVIVTPELMEIWGINGRELTAQAWSNQLEEGYMSVSLDKMYADLVKKRFGVDYQPPASPIRQYVLSNVSGRYGARVILRKDILLQVSEKMGGDFYVLPSSQHEVIAVPDREGVEAEALRQIVRNVNQNYVIPKERLSDNVYWFSRNGGELMLVEE